MKNSMQKNDILTIPNLLSLLRLGMVPVMVWLYVGKKKYFWTAAVLLLSALTDIADGFIARHFNMVSDLGKALDPIADKLTQIAVLFCLISRFPLMLLPWVVLVVKEVSTGIVSLVVIRKTGRVESSVWHGKLTTVLLYATMCLHLLWFNIPLLISRICISLCTGMMLLSFCGYALRNYQMLTSKTMD